MGKRKKPPCTCYCSQTGFPHVRKYVVRMAWPDMANDIDWSFLGRIGLLSRGGFTYASSHRLGEVCLSICVLGANGRKVSSVCMARMTVMRRQFGRCIWQRGGVTEIWLLCIRKNGDVEIAMVMVYNSVVFVLRILIISTKNESLGWLFNCWCLLPASKWLTGGNQRGRLTRPTRLLGQTRCDVSHYAFTGCVYFIHIFTYW